MEYPKISIVTPIYERNKFKRLIISNLLKLDYQLDKLEYIVDDDGEEEKFISSDEEMKEFKEAIYPIHFIYKHYNKKRTIGEKRNNLVKLSNNKLIANMDSDDIMLSDWLKHSLSIMNEGKYGLVGTNQMLFLFPHNDWKVTAIQCDTKRQIHEAGMLYTKKHHKCMGGFTKSSQGEGTSMIDGMNEKTIGLTRADNCILCLCWNGNTINKDRFQQYKDLGYGSQLSNYDKNIIMEAIN
tara:strand:+ start:39 stop:755 length:717 start_codon:yes stop_codon:yes gene_type:complete